ncbi:MAG: DNA polymerase III subunit gamma/tau [Clostridiales bacterium]|nr:DNA polymerase III subunit gamma/tau [Clostridiales bacterium]
MEYQALYRQFRPNNFDEIVEQKAAVATLRKTVLTGKIGHAYLFCGQRGTGKTSIARVFSRAINCEHPVNGNPCNECSICKGILDGSLMDVIEIDAASNRSIDNIRSICEEVSYAPSRAKYKVYIIDEVHMITTEAFNALLKTLEEPPAHAVFLFATTEPHAIPATILSRCQRFDFRRISTGAIRSRLRYICDKESIKASDDAIELIASMSDGAMRDAISYLDQAAAMASGELITPESIEEMTGTVNIEFIADFAQILIEGSFDKLPQKCKELADSGRDFIQFTLDLAEYFRNLLVLRVVPDPVDLVTASTKSLKRMYEIANLTNSQTLTGFIASFSKTISDLKWSPSVRTSFEIAMLRLCGRKIRLEEAPLVIPDFAKLQAEAAKRISEGTTSSASTSSSVPIPKAEVKPEPKAEVKTEVSSVVKEESETEAKSEAKTEAKTEAPQEERKEEKSAFDGFKARLEALEALKNKDKIITGKTSEQQENKPGEQKAEEPKKEAPKAEESKAAPTLEDEPDPVIEQVPAPEAIPQAAPRAEDEEEDEDAPIENQIGLFFDEKEQDAPPKLGIFADLSDSVLDDITMEDLNSEDKSESYEEEEEDELQAPTGRIGETRRTALSEAVDKSPIVRSKNQIIEDDPDKIWLEIKSRAYESDRNLGQILDSSVLKFIGDDAYITIGSDDPADAKFMCQDPGFKHVSALIKHKIPGVVHVFACTGKQYENALRKYDAQHQPAKPQPQASSVAFDDGEPDPAADFIRGLGEAGINTEIHFGDE